jgi:hypothetical protein
VAGRPRMVAGWPARVAIAPLLCPKRVVVELKREIGEGKGGKEEEGGRPATILWPIGQTMAAAQYLLSSSTSSCSYHAHSTDQKHQIPFILFLKLYLFIYF